MRITGGEFRSRRLVAPRSMATRPTQDRVREALFSILTSRGTFDDEPARVLDLYAGTGALGLEALSRGAASAVFVEKSKDALHALRENVATLGVASRVTLVSTTCEKALATRLGGPFDLVFLDPPYADLVSALVVLSQVVSSLAPLATVVLEHGSGDQAGEVLGLTLEDTRVYGDTALSLYAVRAPPAQSE
jgi:16S rRNA (guanine966-N2)-methyltransferase